MACDEAKCPFCGKSNDCALAGKDPAGPPGECWCFQGSIDPERLRQIPGDQRNKACLCKTCAFGTNPLNVTRSL